MSLIGILGMNGSPIGVLAVGFGGEQLPIGQFVEVPQLTGNVLELVKGNDYRAVDECGLGWEADWWPDLTGGAVKLSVYNRGMDANDLDSVVGTVVVPSGTAKIQFDLTAAQTALLKLGTSYWFDVRAELADGHKTTLVLGTVKLLPSFSTFN